MDIHSARKWIIISSLIITAGEFLFFLLAPTLGYPLTFPQSLRLLQIVLPVFFGYLGSAAHFVFSAASEGETEIEAQHEAKINARSQLVAILIRWPVLIFGLASLAAIFAFGYTNRRAAVTGSGMNIDELAMTLSISLGLLAITTNIAVSFLFNKGNQPHEPKQGQDNQ